MAAVEDRPGAAIRGGEGEGRGGGGDEAGYFLVVPVVEEAEHGGCAVELVEAAAEPRAGARGCSSRSCTRGRRGGGRLGRRSGNGGGSLRRSRLVAPEASHAGAAALPWWVAWSGWLLDLIA